MPWKSIRLIAGSALVLAMAGCGEENSYVPPPPPKVTVAQPVKQPVTVYMELTGNTDAYNSVDLEARVQGYLQSIDYKDGALVTKNTLLFGIERDNYEAQLEQAKGSLASAQAVEANTQSEYDRQSQLGQQQFSSQAHVEDALTNLNKAKADIIVSQSNVQLATITLGYTQVTAPFDGIVTRHLVDIGALVGYAGPTKLATIVQVDPIYVYFNVNEQQVLRIKEQLAKEGRTVKDVHDVPVEIGLQTEEGYPHKGTIDYIAPGIDPNTGTLEVRGVLDNKDLALLPGLFARVRVPLRQLNDAILVDDTAIGSSQIGNYVMVVGQDNTVEQRPVKIGQLQDQLRVIEEGVGPDDWVVTGGVQRAIPGNKVEPQKGAMTVAAGEAGATTTTNP